MMTLYVLLVKLQLGELPSELIQILMYVSYDITNHTLPNPRYKGFLYYLFPTLRSLTPSPSSSPIYVDPTSALSTYL